MKLQWGDHHLQTLRQEIGEWGNPATDPVVTGEWVEHAEERYSLVPFLRAKAAPPAWSFIVGDIVSNYRAALNYAAWELAPAKGRLSESKLSKIQFPIVVPAKNPSAADFIARRIHRDQMPGVATKYLRAISRFQPYPSKKHVRWHLDALRVLSNHDKHAKPLLTPTVVRITGAISEPRRDQMGAGLMPYNLTLLPGRNAPEPGTHIARLDWEPGFHPIRATNLDPSVSDAPDVGVNLQIAASVALTDYGSREVLSTLPQISEVISQILQAIDAA